MFLAWTYFLSVDIASLKPYFKNDNETYAYLKFIDLVLKERNGFLYHFSLLNYLKNNEQIRLYLLMQGCTLQIHKITCTFLRFDPKGLTGHFEMVIQALVSDFLNQLPLCTVLSHAFRMYSSEFWFEGL